MPSCSTWEIDSTYLGIWLFLPKYMTLLFLLLTILFIGPNTQDPSELWVYLPILAILPSMVLSTNLNSAPSIPSSKSFMKMLQSKGPKTEFWGNPMLASFHVHEVLLRTMVAQWTVNPLCSDAIILPRSYQEVGYGLICQMPYLLTYLHPFPLEKRLFPLIL